MNKEWSEKFKLMKEQIKREGTYDEGITTLLDLRADIMKGIEELKYNLELSDYYAMPYANAKGYHNKTITYSLYHTFRIEDIVANSLISKTKEVYDITEYQRRLNSPIRTTGNELVGKQIADFSAQIDVDILYEYVHEVDRATTKLLKELSLRDMKIRMTDKDKDYVRSMKDVSEDENAIWLVDYWCSKNIMGLLLMPFSRHWIMHVEASMRIKEKLFKCV